MSPIFAAGIARRASGHVVLKLVKTVRLLSLPMLFLGSLLAFGKGGIEEDDDSRDLREAKLSSAAGGAVRQ